MTGRSTGSIFVGSGGNVDEDAAMRQAIGGEFEAMGLMELDLLISQGLPSDGSVVDIGCGSGRLTRPLAGYLDAGGSYVGTDVVPELLDYARTLAQRPGWRFEESTGYTIPLGDATADIVCFFSVFTHLRHEESYLYLQEAKRVLKPSGSIVFSFSGVRGQESLGGVPADDRRDRVGAAFEPVHVPRRDPSLGRSPRARRSHVSLAISRTYR